MILQIADNGNINFDDSSSANGDFPSDKDRIAVLWEDLDPDPGGKIFYRETTDSSVLMVSYKFHISAYLTVICLTGINCEGALLHSMMDG